jgi:hypothetical protein
MSDKTFSFYDIYELVGHFGQFGHKISPLTNKKSSGSAFLINKQNHHIKILSKDSNLISKENNTFDVFHETTQFFVFTPLQNMSKMSKMFYDFVNILKIRGG